ncbi:MAG: hypothetical protein VXW22_12740, partial [Pseudomonadota bacterium]|nr:hypothetical protein [Pseudomonadota bacterium]
MRYVVSLHHFHSDFFDRSSEARFIATDTYVISKGQDVFFDFKLDSDLIEFDGRARDLRFAPTQYGSGAELID